jgi:dTDP-4-amino-4,6-dideoxygalactose transaminase
MQVPLVDIRAQYAAIRSDILRELAMVLDHMGLAPNQQASAFEAEFAAYCQTRYALGAASGTDALYLALRGCGVHRGDEVITVANGPTRTAEALALLGAAPVFVDVDPSTYTMDPERLLASIGPRARAIVPVHLHGQVADMPAIMAMARQHGLAVIEDASHAPGAEIAGHKAGSIGDAAIFNFGLASNLGAYGRAGVVTTNSPSLAHSIKVLRGHRDIGNVSGHASVKQYADEELGLDSRLDEIQAAVMRVKLRFLDTWNAQRQAHARLYEELLEDVDCARPVLSPKTRHVFRRYVVRVKERDYIRQALAQRGVATGVDYPIPLHKRYPTAGQISGNLRVTESLAEHVLSLPMYPELSEEQLVYAAACLRDHAGLPTKNRNRPRLASVGPLPQRTTRSDRGGRSGKDLGPVTGRPAAEFTERILRRDHTPV